MEWSKGVDKGEKNLSGVYVCSSGWNSLMFLAVSIIQLYQIEKRASKSYSQEHSMDPRNPCCVSSLPYRLRIHRLFEIMDAKQMGTTISNTILKPLGPCSIIS